MKILVTGATSSIGLEVISQLLKKGFEVRSLTRQHSVPLILHHTDLWTSDLLTVSEEIADDIDAVIHIAAATPNANSSAEDYQKTNIDSTKHLLDICKEKNVQRFIYVSTIMVLYENYTDNYTLSKKAAESLISSSSTNWTILRPSEIIGADKSLERFIQTMKKKKIVFIPGKGKQFRHPVYFLDIVKAIIRILDNSKTYKKKYTLAAAKPVTYYNYVSIVKKQFNCNFKILTIPLWIINFISKFKKFLPVYFRNKINNAFNMLKSTSMDIQDAINDFGYAPVDVETGFGEISKKTNLADRN